MESRIGHKVPLLSEEPLAFPSCREKEDKFLLRVKTLIRLPYSRGSHISTTIWATLIVVDGGTVGWERNEGLIWEELGKESEYNQNMYKIIMELQ